jgi:adenylosuccinate synthase
MTVDGKVFKMRHVPCAWHNPYAILALGPGAVINTKVLMNEIEEIEAAGYSVRDRLRIDAMASTITVEDMEAEASLVEGIGSTGEGVGAATAARVMRRGALACDDPALAPFICDVADLTHNYVHPKYILIETTQGFGLSLTRSGHYPKVTSRDITPAQALNDSGVDLMLPTRVIVVLRTFPIRVAGPSGPLRNETTWGEIGVHEERTTVTNNVRRVGKWDPELARRAVEVCRPDAIALTFFDYWRPDLKGKDILDPDAFRRIKEVERQTGTPVAWVSTDFQHVVKIKGN